MSDEELEARIQDANCAMQAAKSKSLQRYWKARVEELEGLRQALRAQVDE
jgi:hypothetical protein